MAAIQMKNANSAIMARRALTHKFKSQTVLWKIMKTYKTTTLFFTAKNASLDNG